MAITPIVGPAGGGKSQYIAENIRSGWIILDFTSLYAALSGAQRGPDGKYPERITGDPPLPLVSEVKALALNAAIRRELSGFVTSSARDDIEMLERVTKTPAVVVDPGEATVRARLADPITGQLSEECTAALRRWYR